MRRGIELTRGPPRRPDTPQRPADASGGPVAATMTDLDALTAACLDDPDDDEARIAVLADWLEERGDARADAVRRVPRWRAAVSAARPEEIPNDSEDIAGLLHSTAL